MTSAPHRPHILVAAAVIEQEGRLLVTQRAQGTHLEGYWEFPGGKCAERETAPTCLAREIREELGAEIRVGRKLLETTHVYDDRIVELHFYMCELTAPPSPQLGQSMRWVTTSELRALRLPPADEDLRKMLLAAD